VTATVWRRVAAVRTPDGAELHATIDGSDDAPVTVVLAHGWTLAQAAWDDVADLLAPRIADGDLRLVRYDQRGHGRSTWGDSEISVDQLGDDLAAVIDQLAPHGPVVLGGHSMGGMTIMCLAASRPELFGDRVAGAGVFERLRNLLPPDHPRHQKMVRGLLYGADATDEMVLTGARIMHASTLRSFIAFMPALGDHDKREELTALTRVPVEIFVGDGDKLTPRRHSRQLAEALPEAQLHEVERTGHMLTQERPRLVTDAVERLLAAATADRAAA